jgi:hypothetical protein
VIETFSRLAMNPITTSEQVQYRDCGLFRTFSRVRSNRGAITNNPISTQNDSASSVGRNRYRVASCVTRSTARNKPQSASKGAITRLTSLRIAGSMRAFSDRIERYSAMIVTARPAGIAER